MKKEEILEASKKENKKKDAYAIEVEAKGAEIASILMLLLAFVYFTYEIFTGKGQNPGFYSLITIFNSALFSYKAIKLEKDRKLNSFTGIVWGLLTVMLIYSYFTGK